MLTLQGDFSYDDAGQPPVDTAEVVVHFPVYSLVVDENDDTVKSLVVVDSGSHPFRQKLTGKQYATAIGTSEVFGESYGGAVTGYLNSLMNKGRHPTVADLSIPFKFGLGKGASEQASADAIFFLRYLGVVSTLEAPKPRLLASDPELADGSAHDGVVHGTKSRAFLSLLAPDGASHGQSINMSNSEEHQKAVVNADLYCVNKQAYYNALKDMFGAVKETNESVLLYMINRVLDLSGPTPQKKADDGTQNEVFAQIITSYGLKEIAKPADVITKAWPSLFNWPYKAPKLQPFSLAGSLHINAKQGTAITIEQFAFYRLLAEFSIAGANDTIQPHVSQFEWDKAATVQNGSITFNFKENILRTDIVTSVHVRVVGFDGSDQYSANFNASDAALQSLNINVDLRVPPILGTTSGGAGNANKKIKGKLVSLTKSCTLKGSVVVQARTADDKPFQIVSSGTSDKAGNFALPYPYGPYKEARALVSLDSSSITTIPATPNAPNGEAISDAFLYILINASGDKASADDCDCNATTKADRLPSQDDLIQSNQFTQDLGGGCMNLSIPNRTLREYNYTAIVRTTDPDVANYTLGSMYYWANGVENTVFTLNSNGKVQRKLIDIDNPIQWQDVNDMAQNTSIYQAVTISTGHVLTYKSEFRADGYSLGNLLYSLPLAPGQKKQIVTFDSSHSLRGSESQSLTQTERLAASLTSEREVVDDIAGNIGETLHGTSDAGTSGVSAAAGAAGSYGGPGASVSANVGVAGGTANANSTASQNSSRALNGHFDEKIKQAVNQNAQSYRQQNSTVITTVQEGQSYDAETTVVANHNHCHTITIMHWEVLRHFAVYQELVDVEECVFIPFPLTSFSTANLSKWADILVRHLLPLSSNTFLKDNTFFGTAPRHPLVPAFDANERVRTNWSLVDYPDQSYDTEPIQWVQGEMTVTIDIPRPNTRYDNVRSLPITPKEPLLKNGVLGAIANFLWGGGGDKPEDEVRQLAFDNFLYLDSNYQSVPPARCIRVRSFQPFSLSGKNTDPVDFFAHQPQDAFLWRKYAVLLDNPDSIEGVRTMLEYYFKDALISEWDSIFNSKIAPLIYTKMIESIKLDQAKLDKTKLTKYNGGERQVRIGVNGHLQKSRRDITDLTVGCSDGKVLALLNTPVTFILRNMRLAYSTSHFNGMLYNGSVNNDILDGATVPTPENAYEKRNPRNDDKYLAQRLLKHLNQNLEYYNRVLLYSMDPQRRYLLLDGFSIQVFKDNGQPNGYRSLASVLKNNLIAVAGNSMVFPVSPGFKVNQSMIITTTNQAGEASNSLLDLYKPDMPPPPYRLSVPSKGVYSEGIMGQCDSCEKVKPDSSQDWAKFTTDEPTAINALTPASAQITDYEAKQPKDFAAPIINLQNAPSMPAPGAGLSGITELLGKSGIFKDVTGLDQNQKNAMATYLSNQEQAKSFAEMASKSATQAHNTNNSPSIMDNIKNAQDSGVFTKAEAAALIKKHIESQIDGGEGEKRKEEDAKAAAEAKKPKPADSLAEALKKSDANVKAKTTETGADGETKTSEIEVEHGLVGSNGSGEPPILVDVVPPVAPIKQIGGTCWATSAAMMLNWRKNEQREVEVALEKDTKQKWVDMYNEGKVGKNKGLLASDMPSFVDDCGMRAEPMQNSTPAYYVALMKKFGPIIVTVNSALPGETFSPHAKVLYRIDGWEQDQSGQSTFFYYANPFTGTLVVQRFPGFVREFEGLVKDDPSKDYFLQVLHFKVPLPGQETGEGNAGPFPPSTTTPNTTGSSTPSSTLATVTPPVPILKQTSPTTCWAFVATMLLNWKNSRSEAPTVALAPLGQNQLYLTKFKKDETLLAREKPAFIQALGMKAEPPANYKRSDYVRWIKQYGPLWVTLDAAWQGGVFSPHAVILTEVRGEEGDEEGTGTVVEMVDPATGGVEVMSWWEFVDLFEQVARDSRGELFVQVVHWV